MELIKAGLVPSLINDDSVVATGGFVGIGFPEELAISIEEFYLKYGKPRNLTLIYAAGQGDGKDRGLNHFAHKGLVKKVIGGHWGLVPKIALLAIENQIEAYNLPQGVISQLFREVAAKRPGLITKVGRHTFVDPGYEGGKINSKAKEDLVEFVHVQGEVYLFYKAFSLDVALLRGTYSDPKGNISLENEALLLENLAIAQATKNSGGKVFVQVEKIVDSINPKDVKIPGILVDYVIISKPENHWQTFKEQYNPYYTGKYKIPLEYFYTDDEVKNDTIKYLIGKRGFEELLKLKKNSILNVGIGMPESIVEFAIEYKKNSLEFPYIFTVEPGIIGGFPSKGLSFGAAYNFDCLIDQPSQFDFYDGGGLDCAFLGMAQVDAQGNVNVSKFNHKIAGAGGFINISQNAKQVVFMGTLTTGGLELNWENNQINIKKEGKIKKFVKEVEQITFNGRYAIQKNQKVLYITERCIFELTNHGLKLKEIYPGVNLKDILDQMEFLPIIDQDFASV
jgi:propionate CoA-transferase